MRTGTLSSQSRPSWLPLLTTTTLILILLLLASPGCHAVGPRLARGRLTCAQANPAGGVIRPQLADCRAVLQHLPDLDRRGGRMMYPLTRALQASPFLPPLSIGHGSCRFVFGFQHNSQRYRPDGVRRAASPPQIPMAAIWRLMRLGAVQITDRCRADQEFGNYMGELEVGDEGVTTIAVTNHATVEMKEHRSELIRRSRERLGMRMTVGGVVRTDYDDDDARYDVFVSQSFDV